jgi:hypothetical protein
MTMKPVIALIVPMYDPNLKPDNTLPGGQGGAPDQTLPGDLPKPEHPIFFPLPPGAPVDPEYGIPEDGPYPDQGLPGDQPKPDQGLPGDQPRPSHPIALPPGGGGGWLPVYIDNTLPGDQPYPDQGLPGDQPRPDQGLPGSQPHPDNTLPDIEVPPEVGISGTIKFKAIWTPTNGWQTIGVIIPSTDGSGKPVPTPSKSKRK